MNNENILCGNSLDYMPLMIPEQFDLIITSPPYAEQRKSTYGGIPEDKYFEWFLPFIDEIKRVLKPTGSFVLNIKEHVNNGVRSTYVLNIVSMLSIVLQWRDTFIWHKTNPFPTGSKKRLKDGFEYCYWFTKTNDYKFFPDNVLVPSTSKYLESEKRRKNKSAHNTNNGSNMNMSTRYVADMVRPSNVLSFPIDSTNHKHPATFPLALPTFFIKLMTEENDKVFDPFAGSGTTLLAAKQLNRKYLGIDIKQEYCDIMEERLK